MNEGKKGYKVVRHAASPSKPETKKRNPVAKNVSAAIGGGAAGAHKDKKKSVKQGETKHKKRVPADMLEGSSYEKKLSILLKMEAVKNKLQAVKESSNKQGVAEGNRPFRGVGGAFNRGDDERHDLDPTEWYIVKDGKMFKTSVYPNQVQLAIAQGYSRTRDEAKAKAEQQGVAEGEKKGLYYYVNKRKKAGTSRPASSPKAPTAQAWKDAAKTAKKEGMAERFDSEYDDEAGMAQSNLRTMARAVDGLLKTIKNNDNLPEWGQEKIAKAEMMLVSVWDYLQSQKAMGNDPQQGVAEGYKEERLKGCKCQHRQGDNKKCPIHGVQEGVAEGRVKDLMYDLKTMSDEEFMAHYKMSKMDARKKMQSNAYESGLQEMLDAQLAEKIPKGADAEYYIKDFEKSNAPQFRGKSKTKRREMAIAAYTASKKKR
jgi:hypothetical protein